MYYFSHVYREYLYKDVSNSKLMNYSSGCAHKILKLLTFLEQSFDLQFQPYLTECIRGCDKVHYSPFREANKNF